MIRCLDDPVQRSVASFCDLLLSSFLRIEFGPGAKSFSRQVLGVGPDAGTNAVARYYQRYSRTGPFPVARCAREDARY